MISSFVEGFGVIGVVCIVTLFCVDFRVCVVTLFLVNFGFIIVMLYLVDGVLVLVVFVFFVVRFVF